MQIANPSLSQVLSQTMGNTLNRSQGADRFSARPVTIEGQVERDEPSAGKEPSASSTDKDSSANKEPFAQGLEQQEKQLLINPPTTSGNISDSLILQQYQTNNPEYLSTAEQILPAESLTSKESTTGIESSTVLGSSISNESSTVNESQSTQENSYPFSNRRSFNGLAGGPLVIQSYLNNEPRIPTQSGAPSSRIDVFI